ncbi:homoserine kinase [Cytobacillus depressus]|uniref:Homoserine kinase n=1 Tax=Cytobacillus depressus TaxID=1602942 RepID=A0A6L3V5Q2_9BACI|nr:homoserine kinase [Cytobacillus depressus]KAB2334739.1 homoserine kinase [Cytobacillus depressus]
MSEGEMLIIKVPGSSANLGPGFDSIGLALNVYLTLEIERAEGWQINPLSDNLLIFPTDETNYILQIAMETAKKYGQQLPGCKIRVKSDIPLARGLGSSAAAIVAGIELADSLCNLYLSKQEKLELASRIEGHPDNAGASLLGGLVVGCQMEDDVSAEVFHQLAVDVIAVIPKQELLTKESRSVLPDSLSFSEAVQAGAVGNLLIAALLSKNYALAGKMMKADLYHHPYRKKLVPQMAIIEENAISLGAFGVALSGAGPTVLCLAEEGKGSDVADGLVNLLPGMDCRCLKIDQAGSRVYFETRNGIGTYA